MGAYFSWLKSYEISKFVLRVLFHCTELIAVSNRYRALPRNSNQALGLGRYAIEFLAGAGEPGDAVLDKTEQFHLDSVACGVAALGIRANAPVVLREEALDYPVATSTGGRATRATCCFGSSTTIAPEKAILANCAAVRELDANGTNFGFNPTTGDQKGEFGHNDFYPVAVAGAQQAGWEGRRTLLAMICLDEIRGRLAEVFALKDHKIDHVLHGAIASAAVYGAVLGATAEQIESAIGMMVAHYVPFRAIRHGHQLSDSKGASAAISAEMAVVSVHRAMRGFVGPRDIFRNPQAIFCLFEPPAKADESPFDLRLGLAGDDFAVMGMHFKLGMYEHQSAGAIQGLMDVLGAETGTGSASRSRSGSRDSGDTVPVPVSAAAEKIERINITIYEPAFSIIGDPHKRDPQTRQSADHSMVYIIATLLRKAIETKTSGWRELMLTPNDYNDAAIFHPLTRELMAKIDFRHGGPEYDAKYPEGIPTTLEATHAEFGKLSSGLVMYPMGHARHSGEGFAELLEHKFNTFAGMGCEDVAALRERIGRVRDLSADEVRAMYSFELR